MKSKVKNDKSTLEFWSEWTKLYGIVMTAIFPLYMENAYFNILQAKTGFFYQATLIYIVGSLLFIIANLYFSKATNVKIIITKESRVYCYFIIFLVNLVISTYNSIDVKAAFSGEQGKLYGTNIIMLSCFIFISMLFSFQRNKSILYACMFGTVIVSILAVLNKFHIDPLKVYENVNPRHCDDYLSTIGNINILASFLCIFGPLFMGLFLYARSTHLKFVYGLINAVVFMAGISSISDSFMIGIAVAFLIFLWFAFKLEERLKSYFVLFAILIVSQCILALADFFSHTEQEWRTLQRYLLSPKVIFTESVFIILLWGGCFLFKENLKIFRNVVFGVIAFIAISSLGLVVYANFNRSDFEGSKIREYILLNDSWGSHRGFIWSRSLELFFKAPFSRKLIGFGPGGFYDFFKPYLKEGQSLYGVSFVDAHNEFLQYLVTTGIVGVISYYGMLIFSIRRLLRHRRNESIILAVILLVWIAQGMFNSPLVFTSPYIFMIMGIALSKRQ